MQKLAKAAAGVLLAAGLIAGCAPQGGVAATVNGDRITVAEVDDGMALAPFFAEPPAPADIVTSIIQARAVIEAARAEGIGISSADATEFLDAIGAEEIRVDGAYSDAVLDLARMNLISQNLSMMPGGEDVIAAVNDFMSGAEIDLNPRYGTWDLAQGGLDRSLPGWIETGN